MKNPFSKKAEQGGNAPPPPVDFLEQHRLEMDKMEEHYRKLGKPMPFKRRTSPSGMSEWRRFLWLLWN